MLTTAGCAALLAEDDRDEASRGGPPSPVEPVFALLREAVEALGDVPLAVRSSGVAEDLVDASFAGQYETVLGVRGADAVVEAVRRCLDSAGARRVAAYSERAGPGAPAGMAVLVQRLVVADASGVAFSADPVTGDLDVVLVSAVRGLGERLVSGAATPDEWTVRNGLATCIDAPEQAVSGDEVLQIAGLARAVEAQRRIPQDLEWALAGGRLFLLQARPITALPRPPRLAVPAKGFWQKDAEHYPSPLTPFGASVYLPALDAGLLAPLRDFGLLFDGFHQISLGGEVYGRVIPPGGKDRSPPPWWVLALACRLAPSLRWRVRAAQRALEDDLPDRLLDRWDNEWRDRFRAEARALRDVDLSALDDEALLRHLDRAKDLLCRGEVIHFRLWAAQAIRVYELGLVCRDLLGWEAAEALQVLTGTSAASAAPTRALDELARLVRSAPAAMHALSDPGEDMAAALSSAAPDVAERLGAYIDRFGHRPAGSYDPGVATLAERPELLVGLIRDRAAAAPSERDPPPADRLAEARRCLATRPAEDRDRFERALAAAARAYRTREENGLVVDAEPSGILRYAAMETGRRLAHRRVLNTAEDAVYLEETQLRAALRGEAEGVRETVARHRAERAWVAAHPGPPSFGPDPGPPPELRGLPPALLHVMNAVMWTTVLMSPPSPEVPAHAVLAGLPGSPGTHTGPARIVHGESDFGRVRPGDVLVCPTTSPVWSVLFGQAGALVTDHGGLLSHPAVIAREHHIPAVLATGIATSRLRDGQVVTVDGTRGLVSSPGILHGDP
ncbi:MAG: hypothetical protein GWN71_41960 [Gammaproteobacteria bacterium]|nr:hypothetical protein [Gammaproteobacteria bacterium]